MAKTTSITEINEKAAEDILELIEQIEALNEVRKAEIVGKVSQETSEQEGTFFNNALANLVNAKFPLTSLLNLRKEREAQAIAIKTMQEQEAARKAAIIAEYEALKAAEKS